MGLVHVTSNVALTKVYHSQQSDEIHYQDICLAYLGIPTHTHPNPIFLSSFVYYWVYMPNQIKFEKHDKIDQLD